HPPRGPDNPQAGGPPPPPSPRASAAGGGGGGGPRPPKKAQASKQPPRKSPPKKTARKASGGGGGGRRPPRGPFGQFLSAVLWPFRLVLSLVWRLSWRLAAFFVAAIVISACYVAITLPPASDLYDGRAKGSVTMLDDQGHAFAWRGEQFGGVVDAKTVSPNLVHAIVSTEDRRFFHHFGVSPRGIIGAIAINLREGRGPLEGHGGSTITQQTAKLLCMGEPYDPKKWKNEHAYEADCRQTTLWRKAKEAVYAVGMEMRYSKDQILTIYMNRAYLGEGTRGFEAASQRYFGHSAKTLSPAEAAMLAGLLAAPTRYAPTNDLARSQNRASVIVGLMKEEGYLTAAQVAEARAHPAELAAQARTGSGGYFADWVMSSVPDSLGTKTTEDVVYSTTYDARIQKAADTALTDIFDQKVKEGSNAQAAVVVMSADGAVRAMVGGRNVRGGGVFNRATQALRQTGSSFKPFVYATALELGYHYDDIVQDTPLTINIPGSGPWSPENYERTFSGPVTLETALAKSLNVPAVRVAEAVGLDKVRQVAEDFGIQSDLAKGPALALGASESTLIEMVGGYAGILNGGSSVTPYGVKSVKLQGDNTPLMGSEGGIGERVIRQDAARELIYMMRQVVLRGSGQRAGLPDREIAGKTGTTSSARDAWFIGFSADYVVGVWMGYDNNKPLTGVTGGGLPAEIFHEVMSRVEQGQPVRPLPMLHPEPTAPSRTVADSGNGGGGGQRIDQVIENAIRNIFGLR
ncbi:transglycosylase domain-containing protein, partial [Pseudooceanicola albus]|uniref:transglycosylase domain-containing protein n=1 Tax=Pseudooceanicola albus TaxID=2692189 RepID=UPI0035CA0B32